MAQKNKRVKVGKYCRKKGFFEGNVGKFNKNRCFFNMKTQNPGAECPF